MTTSEAHSYEVFELTTSVGAFLPWVGKLAENLRHHPYGFAEISFESDGIRLECYDEQAHPISEECVPRNQIGGFSELYEGNQYMDYDARSLTYGELEGLQTLLSAHPSKQPLTIKLESDESDICIKIGSITSYFGYSYCRRPENTKEA